MVSRITLNKYIFLHAGKIVKTKTYSQKQCNKAIKILINNDFL